MECHSCLDQGLLFFSSKAKINQLKIFLHDLIDRETRDGPRPGSACLCPHNHLRPGQGCVTFNTAPHYLASLPRYIRLDSSGSSTIFTFTLWIYWEISVEVKVNLMNDVMNNSTEPYPHKRDLKGNGVEYESKKIDDVQWEWKSEPHIEWVEISIWYHHYYNIITSEKWTQSLIGSQQALIDRTQTLLVIQNKKYWLLHFIVIHSQMYNWNILCRRSI